MSVRAHFTNEFSDITISGASDSNVTLPAGGVNTYRLGAHLAASGTNTVSITGGNTQNQIYQAGIWITDTAPTEVSFPEGIGGTSWATFGSEDAQNANGYFVWKIGHLHWTPGSGDIHGNYTYHLVTSGNVPDAGAVVWSGWVGSPIEVGWYSFSVCRHTYSRSK
jgi:hypothetical protein